MDWLFSPALIGIGQTAALLCFFLYDEPDAFQRDRTRIPCTVCFYLLLVLLQTQLHRYVSESGMGSLPTLPFLAANWVLYAIFVFLWSRAKWEVCCFAAFVLLLIDSCIWPLVSGISRAVWNRNYLYDGAFLLRIPFILTLSALECLMARMVRRMLPEPGKIRLNIYDGILSAALVLPFLYFRLLAGQSVDQSDKTAQIIMTLCCLTGVITLAAEVGHSSNEYEKMQEAQMRSILESQQEMFRQQLHNADTINRKYHDMKNLLLYLRSESRHPGSGQELEQLIESIDPYGNTVSTGNDVIDVILSEKLNRCTEEHITCIPCVDGQLFHFVKPLDLCTLFGNAFDNSIENCRKIPEEENRFIRLYTTAKGNAVVLTVRNTCADVISWKNGLPVSTKGDPENHGYGLRNMRYIAESYGGTLNCRTEGNEFVLSILLSSPAPLHAPAEIT